MLLKYISAFQQAVVNRKSHCESSGQELCSKTGLLESLGKEPLFSSAPNSGVFQIPG